MSGAVGIGIEISAAVRGANEQILGSLRAGLRESEAALRAFHDPSALRARDIERLVRHGTAASEALGDAITAARSLRSDLLLGKTSVRQAVHAQRSLDDVLVRAIYYPGHFDKGYARSKMAAGVTDAINRMRISVDTGTTALSRAVRGGGNGHGAAATAGAASEIGIPGSVHSAHFLDRGVPIDEITGLPPRGWNHAPSVDDAWDPMFHGGGSGGIDLGPDGYVTDFLG